MTTVYHESGKARTAASVGKELDKMFKTSFFISVLAGFFIYAAYWTISRGQLGTAADLTVLLLVLILTAITWHLTYHSLTSKLERMTGQKKTVSRRDSAPPTLSPPVTYSGRYLGTLDEIGQ